MNTQEPLWTDEAIINVMEADASFDGDYGEGILMLSCEEAIDQVKSIRDDYEARLAQQPAPQAMPEEVREALAWAVDTIEMECSLDDETSMRRISMLMTLRDDLLDAQANAPHDA